MSDQRLQWVHGPITVVTQRQLWRGAEQEVEASMGPRSDNRGYGDRPSRRHRPCGGLQWVHGPITVVTKEYRWEEGRAPWASMGPRSDNRGYAASSSGPTSRPGSTATCFNGSTVR